jgi:hypothetical protein
MLWRFSLIFLAIQVVSTLAERHTGRFGFLMVSFVGGRVSSTNVRGGASWFDRTGVTPEIWTIESSVSNREKGMLCASRTRPSIHNCSWA